MLGIIVHAGGGDLFSTRLGGAVGSTRRLVAVLVEAAGRAPRSGAAPGCLGGCVNVDRRVVSE